MKIALFATCLLAFTSPAYGDGSGPIPSRYIGHWSGSVDSCESERDDLTLVIGSDKFSYWESQGIVKAAVVGRGGELAVILEMNGEGETWLSAAVLKISPDGKRLIDSDKELVRYRCSQL